MRPAVHPAHPRFPRNPARSAPHPKRPGVVGRDVYSYEPASRTSYQNYIPGMRPPREADRGRTESVTPIYDALCSEYRRAFRTLPGDRAGEEELAFKGFGPQPQPYGGGTGQGYYGRLTGHSPYPGQSGWTDGWDGGYPAQGRGRTGLQALPPGNQDGRRRGY
ncbi:hypothetical protein J7W19_06640 [Streptomyces mobaraensis NBRC 13819 = DSM 40847]|nr:hypothetical protein J7W19_06640 [Streptomyces mobaraensis NBRC 13819 = DSM 40847]